MSYYRIAVIGDIHANANALYAALNVVKKINYDELVFLGDLLTYGVDVEKVVEVVAGECENINVTLLRGNHDDLYLDYSSQSVDEYILNLPRWIKESISYTRDKLKDGVFDLLPFCNSYVFERIMFAHANPFGNDNWSYLNSSDEHLNACKILQKKRLLCGVFGHTHRRKIFSMQPSPGNFIELQNDVVFLNEGCGPYVLNAGSIGQPRGESQIVYVLTLDIEPSLVSARFHPVSYDLNAHVNTLRHSGLSHETIEKLISFFM